MYFNNLKELWAILPATFKRQFQICLLVSILASMFEIATLGSLLPFITLILKPNILADFSFNHHYLNDIILNYNYVIILLTTSFIIFISASTATRIFLLKYQTTTAMNVGVYLSRELLSSVMNIEYSRYLNLQHTDIVTTIYHKTYSVVHKTILPSITLLTNIIMVLMVGLAVTSIEPILILVLVSLIFLFYALLSLYVKPVLQQKSLQINEDYEKLMQSLNSALNNFKAIRLYNQSEKCVKNYSTVDAHLRKAETTVSILSGIPRFALEAILISFLVTTVFFQKYYGGSSADIIGGIALVAIAGQRIAPLAQAIFANLAIIQGNNDTLKSLLDTLEKNVGYSIAATPPLTSTINSTFKSFELIDISFKYGEKSNQILKDVNLQLQSGQFIGITGESGSGKSTLLDVILTLLSPENGIIKYNNRQLGEIELFQWRNNVSLVSQDVFLDYGTVFQNITGEYSDINPENQSRLNKILEITCLTDEIAGFDQAIHTHVGERGAKISGGQRQRIAIATALYSEKSVLILDEATSALDEKTQDALLQGIANMNEDRTVVLVTHRPSTLKYCDTVYHLENGKLSVLDEI